MNYSYALQLDLPGMYFPGELYVLYILYVPTRETAAFGGDPLALRRR